MRALSLCLAAVVSATAVADAEPWYPGGARASFSRVTIGLEVEGVERELDRGQFHFDYAEAANEWLHIGIGAGLSFDSIEGEPVLGEGEPSGYLFAVFAGARLLEAGGFAADLEARYQGDYAEGDDAGDELSLRLDESIVTLQVSYRFDSVELSAGAYGYGASGEIKRSGAAPATLELEALDSGGAFAAASLRTAGGFGLGLRAEAGARESIAFTFTSRF